MVFVFIVISHILLCLEIVFFDERKGVFEPKRVAILSYIGIFIILWILSNLILDSELNYRGLNERQFGIFLMAMIIFFALALMLIIRVMRKGSIVSKYSLILEKYLLFIILISVLLFMKIYVLASILLASIILVMVRRLKSILISFLSPLLGKFLLFIILVFGFPYIIAYTIKTGIEVFTNFWCIFYISAFFILVFEDSLKNSLAFSFNVLKSLFYNIYNPVKRK